MTWRKVLWAVVAPKCNGLWSSDLRWIKVERRLIPVMCICGGDTPNGFGTTELWKLTRFGKRENRLNLGAHIFRSDYAIMTELAPKWRPFHVLCDDLHIVGDTPYRFGVLQLIKCLYFGFIFRAVFRSEACRSSKPSAWGRELPMSVCNFFNFPKKMSS